MQLTQRCQYALRAMFALARNAVKRPDDPVMAATDIARQQAIPKRFLDGILFDLRQAGLVASRRGKTGGFQLARPAESVSVGDIIRLVDGDLAPVDCRAGGGQPCPLMGGCVFMGLWEDGRKALEQVYDRVSLAELVRREAAGVCGPASGGETLPAV